MKSCWLKRKESESTGKQIEKERKFDRRRRGKWIFSVDESCADNNSHYWTTETERQTGRAKKYSNNKQAKSITHSCMGCAVGVACVRGWRVVMWVLLVVVRYIMLQTCTSKGGAAPGPLPTAATGCPTGAEAWTHGCCLTAVVTSHCCTGLEETKWMERGRRTETLRGVQWWILVHQEYYCHNCKHAQLCSGQALTTNCLLTDLHRKRKQDVVLIWNLMLD